MNEAEINDQLDDCYTWFISEKIAKLIIEKRALQAKKDILDIEIDVLQGKIVNFDREDPELKSDFYRERMNELTQSNAFKVFSGVVPVEQR
jgi:hypothetical protein